MQHVDAHLITHGGYQPQIGEAGEKRHLNNAPDHQHHLSNGKCAKEDQSAAYDQRTLPVTLPPGSDSSIYEKDNEQNQTQLGN